MKKKIVCIVLALVMAFSILPCAAFADNGADNTAGIMAVKPGAEGVVKGNTVNLRTGPGTNYYSISQEQNKYLYANDTFTVLNSGYGTTDSYLWYNIYVKSGQLAGFSGWVRSDLVYIVSGFESVGPIVEKA